MSMNRSDLLLLHLDQFLQSVERVLDPRADRRRAANPTQLVERKRGPLPVLVDVHQQWIRGSFTIDHHLRVIRQEVHLEPEKETMSIADLAPGDSQPRRRVGRRKREAGTKNASRAKRAKRGRMGLASCFFRFLQNSRGPTLSVRLRGP